MTESNHRLGSLQIDLSAGCVRRSVMRTQHPFPVLAAFDQRQQLNQPHRFHKCRIDAISAEGFPVEVIAAYHNNPGEIQTEIIAEVAGQLVTAHIGKPEVDQNNSWTMCGRQL